MKRVKNLYLVYLDLYSLIFQTRRFPVQNYWTNYSHPIGDPYEISFIPPLIDLASQGYIEKSISLKEWQPVYNPRSENRRSDR